jgi:hypothetical protein
MHDAAFDEDGFAGRNVDILAVDPPARRARYSVNGLVPAFVIMRDRHPRVRLQRHFEHVDTAGGVVLALQKSQFERAEVDDFRHGHLLSFGGRRANITALRWAAPMRLAARRLPFRHAESYSPEAATRFVVFLSAWVGPIGVATSDFRCKNCSVGLPSNLGNAYHS